MIHDAFLKFAANQRPAITPSALLTLWGLPLGLSGTSTLDLKVARDLGRGNPLVARFEVATTFVGDAANILAGAVVIADNVEATVNPTIIARGRGISTAALVAGTMFDVMVPQLDSVTLVAAASGRRYLALGLEVLVPTTDWSAGGLNAYILPAPDQVADRIKYASGYSV